MVKLAVLSFYLTFMPSNVYGRKIIISRIVSLNYGNMESNIGVIYVNMCVMQDQYCIVW